MLTQNTILRSLRYTFDIPDKEVKDIFALGGMEVSISDVEAWLKKEETAGYIELSDYQLASFLNGFITLKRGAKEGPMPVAEQHLTNNLILRKLKIALNFKDDEMINTLKLAGFNFSKSELNAFFRKPNHQHYRECKDQFLRNFLAGLSKSKKPGSN